MKKKNVNTNPKQDCIMSDKIYFKEKDSTRDNECHFTKYSG